MRQLKNCSIVLLYCALLALPVRMASAQINPFPGTDMTLSASDLAVIGEVVNGLLTGGVTPTGTKLDWYNGETRRRGTIQVLGSSERDGLPCRALRYTLPVRSQGGTRNFDLTWCKMADGEWKTVAR